MKKLFAITVVAGALFLIWCQKSPTIINDQTNVIASGNEAIQPETWLNQTGNTGMLVQSFEECAKAGFPIMESYPRQCNDGTTTFVEKLENTQETSTWNKSEEATQTWSIVEPEKTSTWTNYEALQQKLKAMMERRTKQPEPTSTNTTINNTWDSKVTEDDIQNLENIIEQIIK